VNKEEIAIYKNDFVKEIWQNSKRFSNSNDDVPSYVEVNKIFEIVEKYKDKEIDKLNNIRVKALEFIYKELIPKNVKWDYDDCIFSDLPVERIKPLVDILELKENK